MRIKSIAAALLFATVLLTACSPAAASSLPGSTPASSPSQTTTLPADEIAGEWGAVNFEMLDGSSLVQVSPSDENSQVFFTITLTVNADGTALINAPTATTTLNGKWLFRDAAYNFTFENANGTSTATGILQNGTLTLTFQDNTTATFAKTA